LRRGRRAVSEVYSALLVLLIAVGVTAAVYTAAGAAARGVEEAGQWVARLASDSAAPVVIVPEVRGGELWVYYESLGSPVREVIVVDVSTGSVLAKARAGGAKGEVLALKGYDCRQVAVAVVLESGAVKVYDARLDPRFAGKAAAPYFSCSLLSEGGDEMSAAVSQEAAAPVKVDLGGRIVELADYAPGPRPPTVSWRQLEQPTTIDVEIYAAPSVSLLGGLDEESLRQACRRVSVKSGGERVALEPYEAGNSYGLAVEGYRGLLVTVDGVDINIVVLCDFRLFKIMVALEAGAPARLSIASAYEMVVEAASSQWIPIVTSLYLVAPGSVSYTATSVYEPVYSVDRKRVTATLEGAVETVNGRVLLAEMPIVVNASITVNMRATVTVEALGSVGEPATVEVKLPGGPMKVAVARYEYDATGTTYYALEALDSVRAFLEATPTYYLKVSVGGGAAETPLPPGSYFDVPRGDVDVSVVVLQSQPCAPIAGSPEIVEKMDRSLEITYVYRPRVMPTPAGACKPHIIIVENADGVTIIGVEPYEGAPNIVYLGQEWEALAPVIRGVSGQGDTVAQAVYEAVLGLPPEEPVVRVTLRNPAPEAPVHGLPEGFHIAVVNGVALAVYAG